MRTADMMCMQDARTSSEDLLLTELPTGLQWQHRHQWPEGMRCWHLQCQRLHLPLRLPLAEPPCTALPLQQPLSLPACIHEMRAAVCADALQDGWQIRASAPAHTPSRQGIWQCCDPACWQICQVICTLNLPSTADILVYVDQLKSCHNMPAPCQCHARQVNLHRSAGERKAKTARHSSLQTVSSLPVSSGGKHPHSLIACYCALACAAACQHFCRDSPQ